MILVTTGTNGAPFDRLLRELTTIDADERIVVQHGPSSLRPVGAHCVDYVSFEELERLIREARVVITHGGVGSVLIAVMNGRRPFVVPRRAHLGEAVDDHQLEFAKKLDSIGLVQLVDDPSMLRELVAAHEPDFVSSESAPPSSLVTELRSYLTTRVRESDAQTSDS